jgi:hypothetical protein
MLHPLVATYTDSFRRVCLIQLHSFDVDLRSAFQDTEERERVQKERLQKEIQEKTSSLYFMSRFTRSSALVPSFLHA